MILRQGSSPRHKIDALNAVLDILYEYVVANRLVITKNTNKRRDAIIQMADYVYRCVRSTYQKECDSLDKYSVGVFMPNDGMPFPPIMIDRISFDDLESNYYSTLQNIMIVIEQAQSSMLNDKLHPIIQQELWLAEPDEDGEVSCDMQSALRNKKWEISVIGGKQYLLLDTNDFHALKHDAYRVLDGNVRDFISEPIASISANLGREIILVDPHSAVLRRIYAELKSEVYNDNNHDAVSIISAAVKITRQYLISSKSNREMSRVILQESKAEYDNVFIMLLDDFIKHRIGVCRHNSLLLAFLLDKLQTDGILPAGHIMHARHFRPNGERHVWVMYRLINSNVLYLVDSTWNVFGDIHDPLDAERLRNVGFGNSVDKCLIRFAHKSKAPTRLLGPQHLFYVPSFDTRVTRPRKLILSAEMQLDPAFSSKEQAEKLYDFITRFSLTDQHNQPNPVSVGLIVPVSAEQAHSMYYLNQHARKQEKMSVAACVNSNLYKNLCHLLTRKHWAHQVTLLPLTCLLESIPGHGGAKLFQDCVERDMAEIAKFIQKGNHVFGVTSLSNAKEFYFGDDPPKWWNNVIYYELGFTSPYRYIQNKLRLLYHECRRINPDYTLIVCEHRLNSVYNQIENLLHRMDRKRVFVRAKHADQTRLLKSSLSLILGALPLDHFHHVLANCPSWRKGTISEEVRRLIKAAIEYVVTRPHPQNAASYNRFN